MRRSGKRRPLFAGAELATKRLAVGLSSQCGRDLIPRPVSGTRLPHGDFDGFLSDAPGIGGGLDQLFNRCRHAIKCGRYYATLQGIPRGEFNPVSGFPLDPRGKPSNGITQARRGTVKPVVSCDLATRTDSGEYDV
jgi:hypothetical protein